MIDSEDQNCIPQLQELEKIRCKERERKLAFRKAQREFAFKKARFFNEEDLSKDSYSTEELVKLFSNLKSKSQVTCKNLTVVMNALLENKENIQLFLNVDGALPALLTAFSGQNEKLQLLAARCICNLALGNSKSALQVLKTADSYLFAHLKGKNSYIIEACCIALGNFSRHGPKHIDYLIRQGFFSTIKEILNKKDDILDVSIIYALSQLIYYGFDCLQAEYFEEALQSSVSIFKRQSFTVAYLISLLSAHMSCHKMIQANKIHIESLYHLYMSLQDNENEAVCYLRIISNCVCDDFMLQDLVEEHLPTFKECVRLLLNSEKIFLKKECLCLIGNILNHSSKEIHHLAKELINENISIVKKLHEELNKGTWQNQGDFTEKIF